MVRVAGVGVFAQRKQQGKDSSIWIILGTARKSGWPEQEVKESAKVGKVHSAWLMVVRKQNPRAIRMPGNQWREGHREGSEWHG